MRFWIERCFVFVIGLLCSCKNNSINQDSIPENKKSSNIILNNSCDVKEVRFRLYEKGDSSTQVILECPNGGGEGIFACNQPAKNLNVQYIDSGKLIVKYPIESFVDQKKTSTSMFNKIVRVIYQPYSLYGDVKYYYRKYWGKEEFLDLKKYSLAKNKWFIHDFLATVSDSSFKNELFRVKFSASLSELLRLDPITMVVVINSHELLRRDLIFKCIDEIPLNTDFNETIKKLQGFTTGLLIEEEEIRDRILNKLKSK